jgi:beta-galactosidase
MKENTLQNELYIQHAGRETMNMNFGWRFHDGDVEIRNFNCVHSSHFNSPEWMKAANNGLSKWGYDDSDWVEVDLPHDFVVSRGEFTSGMTSRQGCLAKGVVWYRKAFEIPGNDEGRSISLEFDGIFRNSTVWVNGHFMHRHLSGYTSFSIDISDVIHYGGINVIAVRVDATEFEGWWYEGGGIYRDVRLVKTAPLHVVQWGTYITSELVMEGGEINATLTIETKAANAAERHASLELVSTVFDPKGRTAAQWTTSLVIDGECSQTVVQNISIHRPQLWSVDSPSLYKLQTLLLQDEQQVDQYETVFGIRSVSFDADRGLLLNGVQVKMKGVCCHEDHAGVGVAVPAEVHRYRIMRLKEMGCNAYRTSHNPPTPALLRACDELGMLVIDETRMTETSKEFVEQLESLIMRDRNHPSVILWSLGNEEMNIQGKPVGVRILKKLQKHVHKLDHSRMCTFGLNGDWDKHTHFHEEHGLHLDVQGLNYNLKRNWRAYDEFHAKYPDYPMTGTENGSTVSTRGLYAQEEGEPLIEMSEHGHRVCVWANEKRKGLPSAYGETYPVWGATPEETWSQHAERDFVAGLFVWTGFDYRGETFPYEWPSVVSRYGIMDLCGFAKDSFYYYQAWWTERPVLHLFPHWNWSGRDGEAIDVWAYTNMDSVELLLNGESFGIQPVTRYRKVEWAIPYKPGRLTAVGYKNGKVCVEQHVETTGRAAGIRLIANKEKLIADREDVSVIKVEIVDERGRFVATANNEVSFELRGPGRIIGTGNGNPLSHEPDKRPARKTFYGLCQVLIQSDWTEGKLVLHASSPGLETATLMLESAHADAMPLVLPYRKLNAAKSAPDSGMPKDDADGGI